jgi:hypothetical protein
MRSGPRRPHSVVPEARRARTLVTRRDKSRAVVELAPHAAATTLDRRYDTREEWNKAFPSVRIYFAKIVGNRAVIRDLNRSYIPRVDKGDVSTDWRGVVSKVQPDREDRIGGNRLYKRRRNRHLAMIGGAGIALTTLFSCTSLDAPDGIPMVGGSSTAEAATLPRADQEDAPAETDKQPRRQQIITTDEAPATEQAGPVIRTRDGIVCDGPVERATITDDNPYALNAWAEVAPGVDNLPSGAATRLWRANQRLFADAARVGNNPEPGTAFRVVSGCDGGPLS